MAAGTLPRPGTELGPCEEECQHTDCAETHRMAAQLCTICGEPISYETPFFRASGDWQQLTHADCLREQQEQAVQYVAVNSGKADWSSRLTRMSDEDSSLFVALDEEVAALEGTEVELLAGPDVPAGRVGARVVIERATLLPTFDCDLLVCCADGTRLAVSLDQVHLSPDPRRA